MNGRTKSWVLAAVAGALLAAYVVGSVAGESSGAAGGPSGLLLPGLADERVTRIRLRREGRETQLEQGADGSWFVVLRGRLFPARAGAAEGLVATLASLEEGDPVTNDPDLWTSFGVDATAASDLRVWNEDGRQIAHLLLGRVTTTGNRQYVRVAEMAQVRLVTTELPFYAERDTRYWSDLRVFPEGVTGPRIVRIALSTDAPRAASYEVYRDGQDMWHLTQSAAPVDQYALDEAANALAVLRGEGFVTDESLEEALTGAECGEIRVGTAENRSFRVRLFCHDGAYYLRTDRLPYTYEATGEALRSLVLPRTAVLRGGGSDGG